MRKIYLLVIYMSCILSAFADCDDDVGFQIKKETLPASEIANTALDIKTDTVKELVIDDVIKTSGEIQEIPENHFNINSPVQGQVIAVYANLGDRIQIGQTLVKIQSADIARLTAEIDQLQAEVELAKNNYSRSKLLLEKGIIPEKDYQTTKAVLTSQEAKLRAAENNLKILTQGSYGHGDGSFLIKAQKNGTIVEKNITVGQIINSNDLLFHAIDLSTVWASANIYEKDMDKVRSGQKVTISLDASPDKTFIAQIGYIDSVLNPTNRTLQVKAIVNNPNTGLKPGQFLQLSIHTGIKRNSIIIPRTALAEMDKGDIQGTHKHLVYLKVKNKYVPKEIEVQSHDSNTVEVISGLQANEILVTQGAYQLQYGEGEHEEDTGGFEKNSKLNEIIQSHFIPITVAIIITSLVIGYLLGRRKKKHD